MTTLAIVYHSGYGHAAALADHVAKGAASVGGVSVKTYKAEELASPDKGPGPASPMPMPSSSAPQPTWARRPPP